MKQAQGQRQAIINQFQIRMRVHVFLLDSNGSAALLVTIRPSCLVWKLVFPRMNYIAQRRKGGLRGRGVLTVTVARSPSGTLATMIPMRKMTASSQSQPRMNAMMKKETPRKTATPVIRWMKWAISRAIGVSPISRPEARLAIRPITVRSPVLMTMPCAVPMDHFQHQSMQNPSVLH